MWVQVKELILEALKALYAITGDYGLAIILLTVGMRVALLPLTIKQTKSMYELQRIQPKIKELQRKYKDDKEKLQEETLKFYQENKVNPFGGCLPLLLQMPVFIALFSVLRTEFPAYLDTLSAPAREAAQRFWIILPNLTLMPQDVFNDSGLVAALPYLLLVVLFGLSVWLPQQLMPGDKQQKQMGFFMAIMMLWFGWISPAGVLVYWVTSSVLGIAQQQVQMKLYGHQKDA